MGALFHNLAAVYDADAVGVADGAEAVGDDDGVAAGHEPLQRFLNEVFGEGVYAGGGFVQNEDAGLGEGGAGDAEQLPLPHR